MAGETPAATPRYVAWGGKSLTRNWSAQSWVHGEVMETDIVLFWFVLLTCLAGLVVVIARFRSAALGWAGLYCGIMLMAVIGKVFNLTAFIYGALAVWFLLVLLPSLLARVFYRYLLQQRYAPARRLARLISWLHPGDGWRQQPEVIYALQLAQQGDLTAATEMLGRLREAKSVIGLAAVAHFFRLTGQWEEFLAWQQRHAYSARPSQLLHLILRAHGEIGDRPGLIELYVRHQDRISRLVPDASRDLCRLMLFAFCGRRDLVEGLLAGSLSLLPREVRQFWLATADWASGASETARRQFEELLPAAEPTLRLAIQRRLANVSVIPEPLDPMAQEMIATVAREHGYDERYGAARSLFSRRAWATQVLIILNVLMFGVEVLFGGSTNAETLYRLGALFPPAVRAGEWWRLFASLFLHLGSLHLGMNMLALWVLGPFAEFALGSGRYLVIYVLSGVGSMGAVLVFAVGAKAEEIAVGASGCIMGLVGATGALMLVGWVRERATHAKRRLMAVLAIIAMQTVFDSLVPQVSMTAHLAGVLIGFAGTLCLARAAGSTVSSAQRSGLKM